MKHYVGIDNANLAHSVTIIDEFGKILKSFEFLNCHEGFEKLRKEIEKLEDPKVAFELPHGPLIDFLRKLPYKLYSLNPLKIKRFKQTLSVAGNKSDKVDSMAIAFYLKYNEMQVKEMVFNTREVETLKLLGLSHERLTQEHIRYSNRLLFIFRQYFPLYAGLFSRSAPKILLQMVLKYPTWDKLNGENKDNLIQFFIDNRYRVSRNIDKTIKKINAYTHHVMPEVEIALSYEAIAVTKILMVIKNELEAIERKMEKITEQHHLGKIFSSLPGAGKILSSKLLGIMGDNKERFTHANQAQSLFGTAPINYQSGGYHKVIMRKACNKRAKATLYVFAFSSLKFSTWAREYYDTQREKGKTHSVAIRALSNKWLKIIYTMWKHETLYKENHKISLVA